jgi:hypothetical protein
MNAISRALKKGTQKHKPFFRFRGLGSRDADGTGEVISARHSTVSPPSSKRKRRTGPMDAPERTPVAKQHLSVREGGDIDLGRLDQEAFARVIASEQQPPLDRAKSVDEEDEEEDGPEVVDVTYRPSGLADGGDPIWSLRMTCLPVLDIFVRPIRLY